MKKQNMFKDKKKIAVVIILGSVLVLSIVGTLVAMNTNKAKETVKEDRTVTNIEDSEKVNEKDDDKLTELEKKYKAMEFPEMENDLNDKYNQNVKEFEYAVEAKDIEKATKALEELEKIKKEADSNLAKKEEESASSGTESGESEVVSETDTGATQEEEVVDSGSTTTEETDTQTSETTEGDPGEYYKDTFKQALIDVLLAQGNVYTPGTRDIEIGSKDTVPADAASDGNMIGTILSADIHPGSEFDVEVWWDGTSIWAKVYTN